MTKPSVSEVWRAELRQPMSQITNLLQQLDIQIKARRKLYGEQTKTAIEIEARESVETT